MVQWQRFEQNMFREPKQIQQSSQINRSIKKKFTDDFKICPLVVSRKSSGKGLQDGDR